MSDCIFCKIIAGEIPASKVYEDEQVLAFLDISQVTPGHTKAAGMNIIANCEEVAGQTVFHTHVHLVPRYGAEDDLKIDFIAHEPDFDKLAQVAETIKNA